MSDSCDPATASSIKTHLLDALNHHQTQHWAAAENAYKRVLAEDPNHSIALCMLGILKKDAGHFDEAANLLTKSIAIKPDYPDAHCHLGAVYANLQNQSEALRCFDRAIALKPDYLDAIQGKGMLLQLLGNHDDALVCFLEAIKLSSAPGALHLRTSDLLRLLNRPDAALDHLNTALLTEPRNAEVLIRRAALLQESSRLPEALSDLDLAITENNALPGAYINKGLCLILMQRYEEAEASYDRALLLSPENPQAHSNRGVLMRVLGRYREAIQHFRTAVTLAPDYAEAHQNLCFALLNIGQIDEALSEFEWRWKTSRAAPLHRAYDKPLWDGKSDLADKTIMLWPEQGPQDVTIWVSCLADLIARAGHCIIYIYPKLVALYQRSFPQADIRPNTGHPEQHQIDFDVHLPLGSLFRYFPPDQNSESNQPAYLIAAPERVQYWRNRLEALGPGPYVGISWKGVYVNDIRKPNYTDVADWAELIRMPAIFINLQSGSATSELGCFEQQHGVRIKDFEDLDLFDDLDEVTALVAALDVVVSVSTAVSALAAGVGTETWVVAWRQSPWHNILLKSRGPNVSYFERNTGERWDGAFATLSQRLHALLARS